MKIITLNKKKAWDGIIHHTLDSCMGVLWELHVKVDAKVGQIYRTWVFDPDPGADQCLMGWGYSFYQVKKVEGDKIILEEISELPEGAEVLQIGEHYF